MSKTDWSRFRVETISTPTLVKRNLIHTDLLLAASRRAGGGILEVGVGSGAQSSLLSRAYRTVSVDNNQRIIADARPNLERFGPDVRIVAGDAFRLPFADGTFGVAISQGLFEHFEPGDVGALLREQLRTCRSVVFSVPSDNYPRQDVGDERLLPPDAWAQLIRNELPGNWSIRSRYYMVDPERLKYSLRARRDLGGFHVLVTIDRS